MGLLGASGHVPAHTEDLITHARVVTKNKAIFRVSVKIPDDQIPPTDRVQTGDARRGKGKRKVIPGRAYWARHHSVLSRGI